MTDLGEKPTAVPETNRAISDAIFFFIAILILPVMAVVLYLQTRDKTMLYLAAAGAALAVWMGWRLPGFKLIRLAMELDRTGITTHGTVLEKLQSRGEKHELHFDILCEYGEGIRVWQEVSEKEFDSVEEGDTVVVRHLLRDPKYCRLDLKQKNGHKT